jgi:hypothetical protein
VVLFSINATVFLPSPGVVPWREAFVGIVLLVCGLAGGIAELIALIRCHERSALVWLAMLPGLLVLFSAIVEFVALDVLFRLFG